MGSAQLLGANKAQTACTKRFHRRTHHLRGGMVRRRSCRLDLNWVRHLFRPLVRLKQGRTTRNQMALAVEVKNTFLAFSFEDEQEVPRRASWPCLHGPDRSVTLHSLGVCKPCATWLHFDLRKLRLISDFPRVCGPIEWLLKPSSRCLSLVVKANHSCQMESRCIETPS